MDKNKKILELLEDDGRVSTKSLSRMLDLSEKEVEKRIDDLKKKNIIRKFKTVVDWKKFGKRHILAIIQIKVVPQEREGFVRICKEISKDPKVKDVFVVTGEYDIIVVIEAADLEDISNFVTDKLAPKKEVIGTYTHIVLNEFKRDGVPMFDEETRRLPVTP